MVIFTIHRGELQALLVRVKQGPFAGRWAFPGGLLPHGESLDAAAARELVEKTGIGDLYLEQLYTFGDPRRDPLGHVVSVAYFALAPSPAAPPAKDPKYDRAEWRPVHRLPQLAYGHNAVAAYALARLQAKLAYSNIAYSLLPAEFTLSELQEVYEIILGRHLDRRNFRKKITTLGLLRPLGRQRRGAHRPAALYAFAQRVPTLVQVL